MPAEEAVIDAPQIDAVAEPVQVDAGTQQDSTPADTGTPDVRGDGRSLKKEWREFKAQRPDLVQDYENQFFGLRALKEKLGDFDLDGTRSWLDENGGRDTINERLTELATKGEELDGLYSGINEGKTDIIDRIPAESLEPLATAAWERYRDSNPEAWSAYQSSVFANTIAQAGIMPFLDKMEMMLQYGDTANLPAQLQTLRQWMGSFSQTPQKPQQGMPQQRPGAPKQDAGKQKWEQERDIWERERYAETVGTQAQKIRAEEMQKELSSFFDRRKGDNEAKEQALRSLNFEVDAVIQADTKFQESIRRFDDKRDSASALRLIASKEREVVRKLAPEFGRRFFGQPSTAKQEPTPQTDAPARKVELPARPQSRSEIIRAALAAD